MAASKVAADVDAQRGHPQQQVDKEVHLGSFVIDKSHRCRMCLKASLTVEPKRSALVMGVSRKSKNFVSISHLCQFQPEMTFLDY